MEARAKTEAINRLRSIAGHVRGIERMLEEDTYCIDVMKQVLAVQAALGRLNEFILENHLNTCVIDAIKSGDPQARERVLDEIADVFHMTRKV
ncbi:MAG: transcriptional regulator [Chloroflexota bacterium]|jgi:DNA-binding FrmR family transcriptional regulator